MSTQNERSLGGTGASLIVLGAITSIISLIRFAFPNSVALESAYSITSGVFGLLALVGFILFLIAMYNYSKQYAERKIFDRIIYGIIFTIVAGVIAGIAFTVLSLGNILSMSSNYTTPPPSSEITSSILGSLTPFLAVFSVVGLVYLVFQVSALNLLAAKSQVRLFNTAAKVFILGAIVQIAVAVAYAVWASFNPASINGYAMIFVPGGLVQYVAWALLAKAFFSMPPPAIQVPASSTGYSASYTATGQTKYCVHCGAANSPDMVYCVKCGKKQ